MAGGIPEYDELKVRVESEGGAYHVVAFGPDGATASGRFAIPVSKLELDNFVLRMTRSAGPVRAHRSSQMDEAKQLGGALFEQLMADDVGDVYHGARRVADSRGRGLRIALYMTGAPELLEIPWELLYDPGEAYFLSQSIFTPVVRALDLKSPPSPAPTVTLPLQVLALASAPEGFPRLDADAERTKLEQALGPLIESGAVQLQWLESATLSELDRRIGAPDELHVVHYIGHGAYDERTQGGILVFEDARGGAHEVTGDELGACMRDERSLRLVVLNSCEGARSSHVDPFSGVASSLLRCGLPAVVGMQAEITDEAAITFSDRLYSALAQGFPIDAALAQARRAIFAAGRDVEFGTPVLFMRVADGRIFKVTGAPPPAPVGRLELDLHAEPELVSPGGTVTWRLQIRNAGRSQLSDVTARDKAGETRAGPLRLDAGEARECAWESRVDHDLDETATVGGRGSDGRLVGSEATAHVRVQTPGGPNWRRIAGVAAAALLVLTAVVLAATGVFSGDGEIARADFRPYRVHTDVGDLDARGDKVAFLAPAPGGEGREIRRLDPENGKTVRVGAGPREYETLDVGLAESGHAGLVYSACDTPLACQIFTKAFGAEREHAVRVTRQGCVDVRPSMYAGLILFARRGKACDKPGLWLKPTGTSEPVFVTSESKGADLNADKLVWLVPPGRLFTREVSRDGTVSGDDSLRAPQGEGFGPPVVITDDYVYFVHVQRSQHFIARAHLPLSGSHIEHYVASAGDHGAEESPGFAVTADALFITKYPQPDGKLRSRVIVRVPDPTFERAR